MSAVCAGILQARRSGAAPALPSLRTRHLTIAIPLAAALSAGGFGFGINAFKAWAMICLFWAGAAFLPEDGIFSGVRAALILWACVVPLPFLQTILAWLQRSAVVSSGWLLGLAGVHVQARGSLVQLSGQEEILIAEACSGLQSVLVLFSLTLFGSFLFFRGTFPRALLAALSLPVAWAANLLRVSVVIGYGAKKGSAAAATLWDAGAGAIFYAISLTAMGFIGWLIKRRWPSAAALVLLAAFSPRPVLGAELKLQTNFTDTNPYLFTSHQGRWWTRTDLFHGRNIEQLPFRLGRWEGENIPIQDKLPVFLRRYRNPDFGVDLYLQPVYGVEESAFHTAEVCYIETGWTLDHRGYRTLTVAGRPLTTRYTTARFEDHRHLILYWYVWPNARRVISDGCLMIRISVEVENGSDADAERAAVDFIEYLTSAEFGAAPSPPATAPKPDLSVWKAALERAGAERRSPVRAVPEISEKAAHWLLSQVVPNAVVRRPAYDRRNLILSYRIDPASPDYRYVFSKSALYDNALAAIAFTMTNRPEKASAILDAVERIASRDGDLFFTFNTHNNWPNARDSEGAVVRTGASAWVGYAVCFYLAHGLMRDPELFARDPDAVRYLQFAERLAERLLVRQVREPGDSREGLLTGGGGRYALRSHQGKIVEEFIPGEVNWCSVEHNIDAFYFLRDLGRLTGDQKWSAAADQIKKALLANAWNPGLGQFNRGVRVLEEDPVPALDCASWGSVLLKSIGETGKSAVAVRSLEKYIVRDRNVPGYKPYAAGPLHESTLVQKFYYPKKGEGVWESFSLVWPEGSFGTGLAYWRSGNKTRAEAVLRDMGRLQDGDGGIPYATREVPFEFSTAPSVASAAWAVILASVMTDTLNDVLFWGP